MIIRKILGGWRLLIGICVAALAVSCAPAGAIPVTGTNVFAVKEYPLVEQSKDNPTHTEFQDWVPADVLAHRAASSGNKMALAGVPDSLSDTSLDQTPGVNVNPESQGDLLSATIAGQPFFIYLDNGEARIEYAGSTFPNSYDAIVTGKQGALAIFNPGSNGRMVWFYALRDGLWYYVEAGN